MHILAVGLNHRTAPVEIREKFTFASDRLPAALGVLKDTKSVLECVIVGTCNRTEIYAVVDRKYKTGHFVRGFMEHWFGVPRDQFDPFLYVHEDRKAIEHLFRVTCGLDSMVIGETQILGQVRDAFFLAQEKRTTGTLFNTLFKQAVTLAKRAHSETGIGENPVSVSYAAVELGKKIFGSFKDKNVLLLGAGKMSELTAKHLHSGGVNRITVVNRTEGRATLMAEKFNGSACSFDKLQDALREADIVISSTGSPDYVLTKEQVRESLQGRKAGRSLFMVDIAVPRDLDPAIGGLSNVYLYDIDDLESIVEANMEERRAVAAQIGIMIQEEISSFEQWMKTLGVTPVIRALQEKSNRIYEETMADMMKKLPDLDERQQKVIRKLAKSIVNQMMRDPILRVKDLAGGRHGGQALDMFTELFALEEILKEQELESKRLQATPDKSAEAELPAVIGFKGAEALAGS